MTRGILWRKRAAHARGGALKPIAHTASTGAGAGGTVPPRVWTRALTRLGLVPVGAGSRRGRDEGGLRTLSYTAPLSRPVPGEGGSPSRRPITWWTCGSQLARHFRQVEFKPFNIEGLAQFSLPWTSDAGHLVLARRALRK